MIEIKNGKDIKRDEQFTALLYGKPGSGKTSTVNYLKGRTLLLDIDGTSQVLSGNENVDVVQFEQENPRQTLVEFYGYAKAHAKEYDNVFVDNLSYYQKLWLKDAGKRNAKNESMPRMQDYAIFDNHILDIIQAFKELPLNVIFTAWETQRQINDSTGIQSFNQFYPELREKALNSVMGTIPVVARITSYEDEQGIHRGAIFQETIEVYAKNQLDQRPSCPIEKIFEFGGNDEDKKDN